jgi:hypothetical protein
MHAVKNRSEVTGGSLIRTPVASWIVLRIAGIVGMIAPSPTSSARFGQLYWFDSTIMHYTFDMSSAAGNALSAPPGESSFTSPKRHSPNPIPLFYNGKAMGRP